MKSIKDLIDLNKKKILLRLDLNVPLKSGKILDTTRIDKIIPTLNFLLKNNSKIIILSHVGRPNGKIVDELSLKPICEDLKKKMNSNIKLITKNINDIDPKHLFTDTDEKILMLENIRFYEFAHTIPKDPLQFFRIFYRDFQFFDLSGPLPRENIFRIRAHYSERSTQGTSLINLSEYGANVL